MRAAWDYDCSRWLFSVIAVLTDSKNPHNYWRVMKHRLAKNCNELVTRCNQLKLIDSDGKRLLELLSFDFFEVLDSVTIARSRKHIEQYYDTADIGKFPTRLTPISRRPHLTDLNTAINYNDIYVQLCELNLAIYTPSDFILPSRLEKYVNITSEEDYSNLTMKGRERGIRKLKSINLLKRLESSVNSFRL